MEVLKPRISLISVHHSAAKCLLNPTLQKLGPQSSGLAVGRVGGSLHQSNPIGCKLIVLLPCITHNCLPINSLSLEAP